MSKVAQLEPVKVASKKWKLDIPASHSQTGKRQRLYFSTKLAADNKAAGVKVRNNVYGTEANTIPPALAHDAVKAQEVLSDFPGVTLTEACRHYAAYLKAALNSCTFSELWSRRLLDMEENKAARSDHYIRKIETLGEFLLPAIGQKLLIDLDSHKLEILLKRKYHKPTSFNNALATLGPFFSFAVKKRLCVQSPMDSIDRMEGAASEILILSLDECSAVIAACRDHRKNEEINKLYRVNASDALAAILLMLFAGVRPEETKRLNWENIHLDEDSIEVPAKASKTRTSRIIPIEPNLKVWLKSLPVAERSGAICPANWKRKWQAVRAAARIGEFNDVLRHTYCTMFYAAHRDINQTMFAMGHTTPSMILKHYNKPQLRSIGVKFFNILPDGAQGGLMEEVV